MPSDDRVRKDPLMRALALHTLANDYRSKALVEKDPARQAQLQALADHWEAKAKEAEADTKSRDNPAK